MGTVAGVGTSRHRNPRVAGKEAVDQALKQAGIGRPDFVFLFATIGYDQQALLNAVREASGGAPVCGCSAEGIIARGEVDESNFSVIAMAVASDELRFSNGLTTDLKADAEGAGRAIARAIQPVPADALGLFLFPDGLTINFDRLCLGIEDELKLGRLLPLLGGTAGDNFEMKRTYQYCNDQVVSDGVAWALMAGQARVAWAVNHGCVSMGIQHTITRAQGNVIYEIDGKPALETVREYMTEEEVADWGKALVNISIGFEAPAYMEEYDRYIIRFLPSKDPQTGSVTIPTEVTEGTKMWMTRRDYDKLAAGIDRLVAKIKAALGDCSPKLVFQFDCAGRGKIFLREAQKLELLERLQRPFPPAPWLGFYTYGEIGPVGGYNSFHNYTAVLVVVY